jgi:CBS domain containing-hemolysin-like protein
MLAGAQLGITVCSIALGRVGEPAVAHLLEKPFDLVGVPDAALHTVSFLVAITVVVILHVLLGEMVPKNIALAGPEKAAMLLVPPYLGGAGDPAGDRGIRLVRPMTVRALGVEPKTELENTVSMVELSEMIAESRSEGLLDPRSTCGCPALQIRNRVVNDVAVPVAHIHSVPVAPAVRADRRRHRAGTGRDRLLPLPGGRRHRRLRRIRARQDVLAQVDDPAAVVDGADGALFPRLPADLALPDALSALRREMSHLALVTAPDGGVCAMVALEDLVEDVAAPCATQAAM